jgi:hypothetical protein
MKRRCQLFALVLISLVISSCSFNSIAVNSSSGLLYEASGSAEAENNYELFKTAVPGNLLLMEGLLSQSPNNKDVLASLTKGYAGYAFAINESDMLNEEWGELKTESGRNQALFNYTRSLNFGLRYLKQSQIDLNDLIGKMNEPQGITHLLDKRLSDDKRDLELVLFTAQSLAALINLQKDNISLVAQLPVAKSMFDWVCMKDPKINYGTCDIFYAAYESGRPKMLGGNPEKGKEIFLRAIENHPHNWLIRSSYMQFYLIPQNDKDGFEQQLEFLKEREASFKSFYIYASDARKEAEWSREPRLRFYQALALKRFELMNKYQKQFF